MRSRRKIARKAKIGLTSIKRKSKSERRKKMKIVMILKQNQNCKIMILRLNSLMNFQNYLKSLW